MLLPISKMKICNHKCIKVIIFIQLLTVATYSQDFGQLNDLYQQRKLNELDRLLRDNQSNAPQVVFFKTIFIENGEEAIKVYESLFNNSGGELRPLVAKKISEYYYARGFYVKANEYAQHAAAVDHPVISVEKINKNPYFIQVGAFGYRDNANRMKELLQDKNIESEVKVRQVKGKTLYCVWIAGSQTYNETKTLADDLQQKYKLKYQIINP